jgi:heme exporter protein C
MNMVQIPLARGDDMGAAKEGGRSLSRYIGGGLIFLLASLWLPTVAFDSHEAQQSFYLFLPSLWMVAFALCVLFVGGQHRGRMWLALGYIGASTALGLAFLWVPSVPNDAFESPDAQRLFYWHVPSAWMAMIAFAVLFVGSALWFVRRSAFGWRLHVAGSEAGLATGLMAVWSGCLWGAAEWGVPWDWTDVRLNSFALLTLLALVLVLGRRAQPDGVESRDTFATAGLFGFVLVPLTYIATRIWQIRHPGPVIASGDGGGSLAPEMGALLGFAALSFTVLIVGHLMESVHLTSLEQRLDRLQGKLDVEATE